MDDPIIFTGSQRMSSCTRCRMDHKKCVSQGRGRKCERCYGLDDRDCSYVANWPIQNGLGTASDSQRDSSPVAPPQGPPTTYQWQHDNPNLLPHTKADTFRDPHTTYNPPIQSRSSDPDDFSAVREIFQYLLWLDYEDEAVTAPERDEERREIARGMTHTIHLRWVSIKTFQAHVATLPQDQNEERYPQWSIDGDAGPYMETAASTSGTALLGQGTTTPASDLVDAGRRWKELVDLCGSDGILLLPESGDIYTPVSKNTEIKSLDLRRVGDLREEEFQQLKDRMLTCSIRLHATCLKLNGLAEAIDRILCAAPTRGMPVSLSAEWRKHIYSTLNHDSNN